MGSCVSISSGSTLKHRRIGSSIQQQQQQQEEDHNNNNNVFLQGITNPSPPEVTENLKPLQPSPNSTHSQNMDYKDEVFFDSQECLDSDDCEDYLSFNGGADVEDHENNGPFAETVVGIDEEEDKTQISTPSTAEYKNKKKLADFFEESLSDHDDIRDTTDIKKRDQSLKSGIKNALTISKPERQKLARSLSSCIPNLNRNMSLSDRTRRKAGADKLPRQKQLTL